MLFSKGKKHFYTFFIGNLRFNCSFSFTKMSKFIIVYFIYSTMEVYINDHCSNQYFIYAGTDLPVLKRKEL